MGGFLNLGGSSAKTDRRTTLESYGMLENIFNFALPAAKRGVSAAEGLLGSAGSYYKDLLSGNRTAALQAVAPEASAATSQEDAAKRQLSTSGTARGGGVAATNATSKDRTMAVIDNLLFGARAGAARGATAVGGEEASLGTNLANLGGNVAGELGSLAENSRRTSYAINQNTVSQVSDAILNVMKALF